MASQAQPYVRLRPARRRRGALAAAVAAGAALAIAGCSSSGGGGGSSGALDSMSAKQIVAKAVADLKAAKSFTMKGSINQSGQLLTIDLGYLNGQGCSGSVDEGKSGTIDIVVIGTTAYAKLSDQFIKSEEGSSSAGAIKVLSGKYLKGTTSNSNVASLTNVCDVNSMTSSFTETGTLTKGAVTSVSGQQVVEIVDKTKGGTMYVTDSATPQIVKLTNTGGSDGSTGEIDYNVGAPVTLTAPPASQVIDGSTYGF